MRNVAQVVAEDSNRPGKCPKMESGTQSGNSGIYTSENLREIVEFLKVALRMIRRKASSMDDMGEETVQVEGYVTDRDAINRVRNFAWRLESDGKRPKGGD